MNIPEEVQNKLKCSECNNLLSCGPIYILHRTGGSICGRCSHQSTDVIEFSERTRIDIYEATASLLSFPCAFAAHGCTEKIPFSIGPPPHELNCRNQPFSCPILPRVSCTWIGPWPNLKQHCDETHPQNTFGAPCIVPQPDLTTSNIKSYLISAFKHIFLLKLKVCPTSGKMYHSVRMFGDAAFENKFAFKLIVEGNNMKFAKSGSVLRAGNHQFEEPALVYTTINCLEGIFSANESKFTMRIETLYKCCANCFDEIETESGAKFCANCEQRLIKCRFHEQGCLFVDFFKEKCAKHERFFCKYQTKCKCEVDFAGGSFFDHMESSSSCRKTSKSNLEKVFRLTRNIDDNKKIVLFSSKDFDTVIGEYKLSGGKLKLRVFTTLASYDLEGLKWSIKLTDPLTKRTQSFTPLFCRNDWWDWCINEDMDNFVSWKKHGIDIKINIVK